MKRIFPLYLFLSLFFFIKGYGQYTAIPDSSFEYALYVDGIDDVMDGRISNAVAESTTVVQVDLEFITDLTGIEAFTNLELLNVSNNDLETIDLSQNTALKEFHADYNNLVALDLSNNQNLEYLTAEFNDIQTIDLSQCSNLEYVNLDNAGALDIDSSLVIPHIDITNSPNLTYLDISGLGLVFPEIDLSQNTLLEHLDISGNYFTSVDVTNNTNLKYFRLGINPNITTLDLSQNTSLEFLKIYDPPITELDLTNNIHLKTLFLTGTDIMELDLSHNTALEYAWIWFVPYLEELDFSNCISLNELNTDSLNSLTYLNLKNGNNQAIDRVIVSLREGEFECVEVDDPIAANLAHSPYDTWPLAYVPIVIFSNDCRGELAQDDYLLKDSIHFYPNPVVDNLHIENTTNQQIKNVFIYNYLGKLVLQTQQKNNINLSHISSGIYYLKIITGSNQVISKQIIKK